jgi:hypothetical protein
MKRYSHTHIHEDRKRRKKKERKVDEIRNITGISICY